MANYSTLKAAVADVVKTNGARAITGANLQSVLLSIINSLGADYQFAGVATPSTDAGTPDQNVFYIGGAGTYANFGTSYSIPVGAIGLFKWNGSWSKESVSIGLVDAMRKDFNDVFSSVGVYVRKSNGKLSFIASSSISELGARFTTDYIDIEHIGQESIRFWHNSAVTSLCFYDSGKNFLGAYSGGSTGAVTLSYSEWSAAAPAGTKYIRCSLLASYPTQYGYVGYLLASEQNIPNRNGYVNTVSNVLDNMVKSIELDTKYTDYDHVSLVRLNGWSNRTDTYPAISIYGWKDGVSTPIVRAYSSRCYYDEDEKTMLYFDGKNRIVIDYSKFDDTGDFNAATEHNMTDLSPICFKDIDYRSIGSEYVIYTGSTSSSLYESAAASFSYLQYKYPSNDVPDITVQRVPYQTDLSDESEYFMFYIWDGTTKIGSQKVSIGSCTVVGNILSFSSEELSFDFDYSVFGSTSRVATATKTYITLQPKCFTLLDDIDYRKDLFGRKYANVSSSTFSAYAWHELCVKYLGMEYSDFGMKGASHKVYASAKYNPDYQVDTEPTVDRCVMNMLAKLFLENVNSGYYPDVIASCCVLNDCYKSIVPVGTDPATVMGSVEDAVAATLPSFDLSTAESIVSDFTAFFNDSTLSDFKSKAVYMMRLALELISEKLPKTQMLICSCQTVLNTSFNQSAIDYFNEAQKKLAHYYSMPYVDLNGEVGINRVTATTFLKSDLLHPNTAGALVYSNYYREQLINRIAFKK